MSILVLAPIKSATANDNTALKALRALIAEPSWTRIQHGFLRHLPMLHMARLQIIEHLTPAMGDENEPDELRYKYLLFIAEIDGRADALYDHMFRQEEQSTIGSPTPSDAGTFVRRIWDHCAGFPPAGSDEIHLFRRFMQRYEIDSMLNYPAVPQSRDEILRALCIRELTALWMVVQQGLVNPTDLEVQVQTQKYLDAVEAIEQLGSSNSLQLYIFMFEPPPAGTPNSGPISYQDILDELGRIT